jgi:hypothetical protein
VRKRISGAVYDVEMTAFCFRAIVPTSAAAAPTSFSYFVASSAPRETRAFWYLRFSIILEYII